jgi:hypothetical protein
MTEDERKKRFQVILDKHDEALRLMREALTSKRRTITAVERVDTTMATSVDGMRMVLDALAAANYANRSAHINVVEEADAVDRAIDLVLEANQMTTALLNEL